jgi:methionine-rich copper-binding protein CopC
MEDIMKHAISRLTLAAILALGLTAGAEAHAKLVKSDPPAGGVAKDKKTLELTFNETISGKLSGAEIKDAAGKKVAATSMVDQGEKGLMVMAKAPLASGAYKVTWHAVASDDGHRTTGSLAFKVK